MLTLFICTLGLVLLAVLLLCVKIIARKNGRFSSMHIADSKPMRERGITCANSQDRLQRRKESKKMDISQL